MKRKPFQSILTVLLGVGALGGIPCTAPLTYAAEIPIIENKASAIEDKGTTWWSVEELLKFNQEVEAEKDAKCGDNHECRMEFESSILERGPKYSALCNLLEAQIWITSINPAAETVRVLFLDDDITLHYMGIEKKLELEHLYIGWFDEWKGQIYNYDHDGFTNGTTPGSHPLYDSTVSDISEIIPWEEVELSVAGGSLANNVSGKLDYAAFAKYNMFNTQGYLDYSNCLNAPDYLDGMECQMMVSGDQWVSYFPPREQIIETPTIDEPTSESKEPTFIEPINKTIKTPETGKSTKDSDYSVEMPRWLIVLNVLGFLFIVWWFLPSRNTKIRRKFEKKVRKNEENLLTNK